MARAIGCSSGHLKNVETAADRGFAARNQLSAVLVHRSARIFTIHLGRPVSIDEFTHASGVTAADGEAA